jgi:hypothetical protein
MISEKHLKIKFASICSSNLSKIFLILTIIQRGITINVNKTSCKVVVFLSDVREN